MIAVEPYPYELPGPVQEAAPSRRARSARRTSNLDATRGNEGAFLGASSVEGRARDLLTAADGDASVVGEASLLVTIGSDGRFASVEQSPDTPSCTDLVGAHASFAMRSGIKDLLVRVAGTPLGWLVDDLAGAPAPGGYGALRERVLLGLPDPPRPPMPEGAAPRFTQTDVCAGWRAGGAAASSVEMGAASAFDPDPAVAPELVVPGDELAWHAMAPLGHRQSRRLRRLDVWRDRDRVMVDTMFRDSTTDPDLTERVVHEYAVTAVLDGETFVVLEMEATPRTLPFASDCPYAAGSAQLIVGHRAGDLRTAVKALSRGPVSCTHLNDLYRSLADVPVLARALG